ncbi:MAG: heparinase, partial [Oceanicaulis sp.]
MSDLAAAAGRRLRRESSDIANALSVYRAAALSGKAPSRLAAHPKPLRRGDKGRGAAILSGRFQLVGEMLETEPGESVWDKPAPSRRFAEALHRFGWLNDLLSIGDPEAAAAAQALVDEWIERFGGWNWFSWEPRVLEGRLSAWLLAHEVLFAGDEEAVPRLRAAYRQARRLARAMGVVDADRVRLDAAISLALAALCLDPPKAVTVKAGQALSAALETQILADGGKPEVTTETLDAD